MKLLVLILGILVTQSSSVNCFGFFDYMFDKINSVAETIGSAFREFGERINSFIVRHRQKAIEAVRSQPVPTGEFEPVTVATRKEETDTKHFEPEPAALLSTPQLAALHGKKVDSHVIRTKDGYLLTLHRISAESDSTENSTRTSSGTVLLLHGLLGSSADWILLGPGRSLPYILSNVGYDVWMMNARGNYYSRGHIEYKVESRDYWNFSFHEIGQFDIPATLEYIWKVKNNTEQINFIGHSMGASALLVLLSTQPKYNDYFRIAIFLAPLVYMTNVKGPLRTLTSLPSNLSAEFREGEFLSHRKVPHLLAKEYCKGPKIYCNNPLFFFSGTPDYRCWNDSFVARLLSHVPAGGSTKTMLHYEQLAVTGKFHKYGDMYSEYPLANVTIPIALFSSNDDYLATVPDVLKLFYNIKMPIDSYVVHGKNITHTDFVWGTEADTLFYPRLLEYLENAFNYTSTHKNEI